MLAAAAAGRQPQVLKGSGLGPCTHAAAELPLPLALPAQGLGQHTAAAGELGEAAAAVLGSPATAEQQPGVLDPLGYVNYATTIVCAALCCGALSVAPCHQASPSSTGTATTLVPAVMCKADTAHGRPAFAANNLQANLSLAHNAGTCSCCVLRCCGVDHIHQSCLTMPWHCTLCTKGPIRLMCLTLMLSCRDLAGTSSSSGSCSTSCSTSPTSASNSLHTSRSANRPVGQHNDSSTTTAGHAAGHTRTT
jgi:hypothetical protein